MNLILILFTMENFNNDSSDLSVQTYSQVSVQSESSAYFNPESFLALQGSSSTDTDFQPNVLPNNLQDSSSTDTDFQPNVLPNNLHVDAEVQTKSLWKLFKQSLNKLFCHNSSDIDRTPQDVVLENTMNNLDPSQNIPANEVISRSSESNLQNVVDNEVISRSSESNLQNVVDRFYDIMDDFSFAQAINHPESLFDYTLIDSVYQYVIYINNTILTVNPDIINPFL
jgi:hypothetical protein